MKGNYPGSLGDAMTDTPAGKLALRLQTRLRGTEAIIVKGPAGLQFVGLSVAETEWLVAFLEQAQDREAQLQRVSADRDEALAHLRAQNVLLHDDAEQIASLRMKLGQAATPEPAAPQLTEAEENFVDAMVNVASALAEDEREGYEEEIAKLKSQLAGKSEPAAPLRAVIDELIEKWRDREPVIPCDTPIGLMPISKLCEALKQFDQSGKSEPAARVQALEAVIDHMRYRSSCPDDKDAGSVWSWRLDEWADELQKIKAGELDQALTRQEPT